MSIPYLTHFLCHPSCKVLHLLNNTEVVFRSNSMKMMNILDPLDFLMLKVSNQNHIISNCHLVDAKILKRHLRLHIHALQSIPILTKKSSSREKVLLAFQVLKGF